MIKIPHLPVLGKNCQAQFIEKNTYFKRFQKVNETALLAALSKSTRGEQSVKDILKVTRIFVYVCIYLCVSRLLAKRKTMQT